jgi:hypothetical protein
MKSNSTDETTTENDLITARLLLEGAQRNNFRFILSPDRGFDVRYPSGVMTRGLWELLYRYRNEIDFLLRQETQKAIKEAERIVFGSKEPEYDN